ncbi:hydrogenase 2 large subunit [Superficieibacter electus]|uniref:hydrogenase (acceptor) n=1 Tax=Superficieibacter electus TaxID=2022662 RepID=A0A2P5GND0_9ENTR|nr:hydrogenase 2 large subunit [Superficieibacter electus]POP43603.1 hydrogenase 2 large subunit [Superficieibacter electus]POP48071.1 hydrogenase 2 large subunit [Superficieibacter electus]
MSQRITIDPVTRIEGHLRIDCEIEDGKVVKAWSSGTMWRGMEEIVKGQDPRDAWIIVQRICGVCTTIHAIASVRAVENALQMEIPLNAQYIRNLILSAHQIHDHIVHFYQLSALDWVDITAALKADPSKAEAMLKNVSTWPLNSAAEFTRVQHKVQALVDSGQLGIFANGYQGHPEMKLSPEVSLIAVAHYLQALECQRDANRIVAILGGKTPHIQNLAVGGVANPINTDAPGVLNLERLMYVKSFIDKLSDFIEQVYKVDAAIFAASYPDWMKLGKAADYYLAVPDMPVSRKGDVFRIPGGYMQGADFNTFQPIASHSDPFLINGIEESGKHAWYQDNSPQKPWQGTTIPHYTGWHEDDKYSWVKAPTFYGKTVEVGPLAWLLCGLASKHAGTVTHYDSIAAQYQALTGHALTHDALQSTWGRILGRAVRTSVLCDELQAQYQLLVDNIAKGDCETFIKPVFPEGEIRGVGFEEASRGMLSHWIVIKDGKIANYQAVVPSTWNAGPRNFNDEPGPYERALVGTPVVDAQKPLEVVRTVHSFDPCMSCAVHMVDLRGKTLSKVKIL